MEEISGIVLKLPPKSEIRMRHVEQYYEHMRQTDPLWRMLPIQELARAYTLFAIKSQWVELTAEAIDELEPWKVVAIAKKVDALIGEALAVPKV
jgi:hypothetical protein